MFLSIEEAIKFVKDEKVEMVDFKVIDLIGRWHHVTIPASQFSESIFIDGMGLDASSYHGYKDVHESDMKIIPDNSTCILDPFAELKTLSLICDVVEADGTPYNRCPRSLARRAVEYMPKVQRGKAQFGMEIEWYMFNDMRYASSEKEAFYYLDSADAFWNTGTQESPNLGCKFPKKGGYHGIPPADRTYNLRSEMVKLIEEAGIAVKIHHHEVGSPCQLEITLQHDGLLRAADAVMVVKYIVKNIAYRNQMVATFMPKPVFQEGGNAGHVHQSISDNGISLFYDPKGYACLSQLALNYIGGLLTHAPALCALTNPSTNSYKRLVPGYEAPTNLFFSTGSRQASAVRIPAYELTKQSTRVEFRPPDATCNPYLSLSAQLMAGLDGIENKMDPTEQGFGPFDVDITELSDEERAKIGDLPASLEAALDALRDDHDFLLKGGVFDEDLINFWIKYKRQNDVLPLQLRPHPYEFVLYNDV